MSDSLLAVLLIGAILLASGAVLLVPSYRADYDDETEEVDR